MPRTSIFGVAAESVDHEVTRTIKFEEATHRLSLPPVEEPDVSASFLLATCCSFQSLRAKGPEWSDGQCGERHAPEPILENGHAIRLLHQRRLREQQHIEAAVDVQRLRR